MAIEYSLPRFSLINETILLVHVACLGISIDLCETEISFEIWPSHGIVPLSIEMNDGMPTTNVSETENGIDSPNDFDPISMHCHF